MRVERDWFIRATGRSCRSPMPRRRSRSTTDAARSSRSAISAELEAEDALRSAGGRGGSAAELQASRLAAGRRRRRERRRLARDLHDGAQQRLVQATIELQLARRERRPAANTAPTNGSSHPRAAIDRSAGARPGHPSARAHDRGLAPRSPRSPTARRARSTRRARGALPRAASRQRPTSSWPRHSPTRKARRRAPRARERAESRRRAARSRCPTTVSAARRGRHPAAACDGLADRVAAVGGTLAVDSPPAAARCCGRGCRSARSHLSTASTRRCVAGSSRRPSLPKMLVTCFSTVPVSHQASAMPWFDLPGHQLEHLALARCQRLERIAVAAPADRAGRRPRGRGPSRPAATRRTASVKALDVGNAVLEQVAHPRRVVADQFERIGLVEVLGHEQHADAGQSGRRISIAARRPSSAPPGGICTSVMTTSGRCATARRTRSSASPVLATTS